MSLAAVVLTARAENRSKAEMQAIAVAQLSEQASAKGQFGTSTQSLEVKCIADETAYCVFAPVEDTGFVIVAKSNLADPVLGYSTEAFPTTDMPDGLRWFLKEMSLELDAAEQRGTMRTSRKTKATYTKVANFIKTKWSQDYPYNKSTPNACPVGCVATSLAQCLNYNQWPQSVEFEGMYFLTSGSGEEAQTERKTENVSSTYTWPYETTYKAMGKLTDNIDILMRDCGYAVFMQYATGGSGTQNFFAGRALTKVFQYPEESVKYLDCWYCENDDTWAQIIYDELAAGSPIMYGAHDEEYGGHSFVFSGVDDRGMVYVNWGWAGAANGYYAITNLAPRSSNYNFTLYADMIYGIRKEPLATDHIETRIFTYSGEPYTFRFGTESDENGVEHQTLFVDIPYGFVNLNATDFKGAFGLFAQDLTDGTSWVIAPELQDRDEIPSIAGAYGDSEEYKSFAYYYFIDGEKGLKPGHTYRMSFGACDDREGVWHSILCEAGELAYDITYTGDLATSTIGKTRQPVPLVDSVSAVRTEDERNSMTSVYDLQGKLVFCAPSASFSLRDVPAHGVLLIKQKGSVRKVLLR